MDLLLLADDGMIWRKRYYGKLFLMLDAQSLDLVEPADERADGTGRQYRLRSHGVVDLQELQKLHFLHCGRES